MFIHIPSQMLVLLVDVTRNGVYSTAMSTAAVLRRIAEVGIRLIVLMHVLD